MGDDYDSAIKILTNRIAKLEDDLVSRIYIELVMGAAIFILLWRSIIAAEIFNNRRERIKASKGGVKSIELDETDYQ
jgi:hypothetical protein